MREYVRALIYDAFQDIINNHIGTAVDQHFEPRINCLLAQHVYFLESQDLLPRGHRVRAEASFDEYLRAGLHIHGLEDIHPCVRVQVVERIQFSSPIPQRRYSVHREDDNQLLGYCDEIDEAYNIAMLTHDRGGAARARPIPMYVVAVTPGVNPCQEIEIDGEILDSFGSIAQCCNQMIQGYWVEADNQNRETCLFCDGELKEIVELESNGGVAYKVCEECDKR